jgi:hypothetical protein
MPRKKLFYHVKCKNKKETKNGQCFPVLTEEQQACIDSTAKTFGFTKIIGKENEYVTIDG